MSLSGDHTWMATPVPIPNTAVKHPGPMVVLLSARVGYCRISLKAQGRKPLGFLLAPQAGSGRLWTVGPSAWHAAAVLLMASWTVIATSAAGAGDEPKAGQIGKGSSAAALRKSIEELVG